MRVLLISPPFCPPTMPPYALAYLRAFLGNNTDAQIECLDLNAAYHRRQYTSFYGQLASCDLNEYAQLLQRFDEQSREHQRVVNKLIRDGQDPPLLQEMLALIHEHKPDIIACSLVYSSQCFYAKALLEKIKDVPIVIGGPASNSRMPFLSLPHEIALMEYLISKGAQSKGEINYHTRPDFSAFPATDYLSRKSILPLRTCVGCYYKLCSFCSHHGGAPYLEFDKEDIAATIKGMDAEYIMLIDDSIPRKRLLELAPLLAGKRWWCQLRPTKDLIPHLPELRKAGLSAVAWGVESGSQRMLDRMKKGTRADEVSAVLKASHEAGIINMAYVLFGFPGETKEDFMLTIDFLKNNPIDLVSTSIFGLQKGSPAYEHPEELGLSIQIGEQRSVLEPRISYRVDNGLTQDEAKEWRQKYIRTIRNVDRIPRVIANFKEQGLLWSPRAD